MLPYKFSKISVLNTEAISSGHSYFEFFPIFSPPIFFPQTLDMHISSTNNDNKLKFLGLFFSLVATIEENFGKIKHGTQMTLHNLE